MTISEEEQLKKATAILKASMAAPYYAEKYKDVRIPETWDDWYAIPPLERNELYRNTYPRSTAMFTGPLCDAFVSSTGGSTGVARTIVLKQSEWNEFSKRQSEAFGEFGLREDDRVANMFVAGHLWPTFLGANEMIMRNHCVNLPISANIGVEEAYRLCREYKPTVMISLPTFFVLMADLAKKGREAFRRPSPYRLRRRAAEPRSGGVCQEMARRQGSAPDCIFKRGLRHHGPPVRLLRFRRVSYSRRFPVDRDSRSGHYASGGPG